MEIIHRNGEIPDESHENVGRPMAHKTISVEEKKTKTYMRPNNHNRTR